jgi:hypothetical protein
MKGVIIDKLIYAGSGIDDVEVAFKYGINAIIGSSNTGKSFIFKSIDFMFAKKDLTPIKELEGFDTLYMVLNIESDTSITLKRQIYKNSKLFVYRCPYEEIEGIKPEEFVCNVKSNKSMNNFYYSLIGVTEPLHLQMSKDNTRRFTVRYLIKYFMLDENRMIEDTFSPLFINRQHSLRTFDRNAFYFLISNYNETEKCTLMQVESVKKIENQLELIDTMIGEYSDRLKHKELEMDSTSIVDVDSVIATLKEKIVDVQSQISTLTNQKVELENQINCKKMQISNLDETQQRFKILNQQYQNEIERYEFIYQGSFLMNQLPKRKCPVCNNDLNIDYIDSDVMFEAMMVEKKIIIKKQTDLQGSINDIIVEIESINKEIHNHLGLLEVVNEEVSTLTKDNLSNLDQQMSEYILHEQFMSSWVSIKENIELLKTRRTTLESKTKIKERVEQIPVVSCKEIINRGVELLCNKIANKLEKWLYPNKFSVKFDESYELVINDKARSSYGKGYKSLIHTAYYLAMFDVMKEVKTPSFNFMIFDSPLTAYTDKEVVADGDVTISDMTIQNFYKDLQNMYSDDQIIIIDNKKVPVNSNVHEIHYSHNDEVGTYGLFPTK